jgi:hypothetical protein
MESKLKFYLKTTWPYRCFANLRHYYIYWQWNTAKGKELSPHVGFTPHVLKRKQIQKVQSQFNLTNFLETGTFMGEMISAQLNIFSNIHSIEIDSALHGRAQKLFRKYPHVHIYLGDSGEFLPKIIKSLPINTLFWLDAHFMGPIAGKGDLYSPIRKEVEEIVAWSTSCPYILIDDASSMNGKGERPSVEDIKIIVQKKYPLAFITLQNNILMILPEPINS